MTEQERGFVADWTKKRSTARLERDLAAAIRAECLCDPDYSTFVCGKHRRIENLRWALAARRKRLAQTPEHPND